MVYGSIANGKKPGKLGPSVQDVVDPGSPTGTTEMLFLNPVDPESNITYELGYKAAFLEQRLIMDFAVYYIDWDDIVLRQTVTELDGQQLVIPTAIDINAGDGESKGFEIGLNWQIIERFNLGLGYSYTDAELTSGVSEKFAEWPSFGPDGNMAGQTLPRQPENQANLNATWAQKFSAEWGWYVRGDVMYQSKWYVDLDNQATIPGMAQANLRFGVESDHWTIEIWGRNINDNDEASAAFRDVYFSNALPDGTNNFSTLFPWRMSYANPVRSTYGITARARF
jgi:outer membrane receptor protein involved in Fe transport